MKGYLGEIVLNIENTPFKNYTPSDWVIYFIVQYGGCDGEHHKIWLIDQIARILKDTKPIIKLARWENGHSEYRIDLNEPTKKYRKWVKSLKSNEYDSDNYIHSEGIPP